MAKERNVFKRPEKGLPFLLINWCVFVIVGCFLWTYDYKMYEKVSHTICESHFIQGTYFWYNVCTYLYFLSIIMFTISFYQTVFKDPGNVVTKHE